MREGDVGQRKERGRGIVEVEVVPRGGFFLCVWRDLNTVIYFTSPKQIRQDISTQAEN